MIFKTSQSALSLISVHLKKFKIPMLSTVIISLKNLIITANRVLIFLVTPICLKEIISSQIMKHLIFKLMLMLEIKILLIIKHKTTSPIVNKIILTVKMQFQAILTTTSKVITLNIKELTITITIIIIIVV